MGKAVVFWLAAGVAAAQSVSLTINTSGSLHTIDEKIYGQTLANGGVWGEEVRNRSFEESLAEGSWKVNSGVLEASGDGRLRFGSETWRDYEVSLDVARPAGSSTVLSVAVRSTGNANYTLAMGGSRGYELSRADTVVLQTAAGQMEAARWYNLRLRVEGQRLQVWLDGRVLFDVSAGGVAANGQAFVAARGGAGSFAHLAVKSLSGAALMSGVPTPARHWSAVGSGELSVDGEAPPNGKQSLRMIARAADSGVEQSGIAVRARDALRGSLWASGTGAGLVVRLMDGAKVLAEQAVAGTGAEWKEFPLVLTPAASGNATLRILSRARSNVRVDQVSLMADSSRANGGFRPDATQAIAALRPPVLRWPGGSLAGGYRWKDGIGPQVKRTGRSAGDEWDSLAFGIDEFMALAQKVNAEPVIVVWAGSRTQVDRAPYLREVLDLIEYCNGAAETTWGKLRAQNGHPAPYRVKYWEISTDAGMPADGFADLLAQFVPAMRLADPGIRMILSADLAMVPNAAEFADYLSAQHHEASDRFAEGPAAAENLWRTQAAEIARSKNPRRKLFVPEWNMLSMDWRAGLHAAGMWNAMEREAAVTMSAPTLSFPSPDYAVTKLFREHYAPELLQISGPGELNATATRSADGDRIFVKVVNPHEVPLEIQLRGDFPLLAAGMKLVAPDGLSATAVQVVDGKIERSGMKARVTLPRWSVGVITLTR